MLIYYYIPTMVCCFYPLETIPKWFLFTFEFMLNFFLLQLRGQGSYNWGEAASWHENHNVNMKLYERVKVSFVSWAQQTTKWTVFWKAFLDLTSTHSTSLFIRPLTYSWPEHFSELHFVLSSINHTPTTKPSVLALKSLSLHGHFGIWVTQDF